MNIFLFDRNPVENARCHPDKLIVKMPLEACQMVATVMYIADIGDIPKWDPETQKLHEWDTYSPTHQGHPMVAYGLRGFTQLEAILTYGMELCYEYRRRYKKTHGCYESLRWAQLRLESHKMFCRLGMEPQFGTDPANLEWPNCTNDEIRSRGLDVYESYRQYLIGYKAHYACWSHSKVPCWWPNQDANGAMWSAAKLAKPKSLKTAEFKEIMEDFPWLCPHRIFNL